MLEQKFYNDKYTKNPKSWAMQARDDFICKTVEPFAPFKKIIDLGCGNGHTLEALGKAFPQAQLYGVDYSKVALEIAQTVNPKAVFWNEDILTLGTRMKFDLVVNLGSLEHIEDVGAGLDRFKSLISANGIGYFEAPNNLSYSPGEHNFRRLKVGSKQVEWHFDRKEWETLFEKHDLEILKSYKGLRPSWEFIWILK